MAKGSASKQNRGRWRRALVTGASVGIGAAFAAALARRHCRLIIVARGREQLESLAQQLRTEHGVEVEVLAADLTESSELRVVEKLVEDADLDLLVNNAGFGTFGAFTKLDLDKEERQIRLNVIALTRLTRAALPGMIAHHRGAVINVSSMSAFQPDAYNATYGATKAFVNSFTEALHEELRGTGVGVQVLCPGFTRTEFQERAGIDVSDLPGFVWMQPAAVVEASLAALQHGDLICVPGVTNRAVVALTGMFPRSVARHLVARMARRYAE